MTSYFEFHQHGAFTLTLEVERIKREAKPTRTEPRTEALSVPVREAVPLKSSVQLGNTPDHSSAASAKQKIKKKKIR